MIQEYLFPNSKREKINAFSPDGIEKEIIPIENAEVFVAKYSVKQDSEPAAKSLSVIHKEIVSRFQPVVLTNDSAAYYNRRLFPLINEFERKLRKLLYLKSAFHRGEKAAENIINLEAKSLGEIFDLLFTDDSFILSVKNNVNKKTWKYSKAEIIGTLQRLPEEVIWDQLIGTEAVPALRNDYPSVRNYRNDVMHAHDIDHELYKTAKHLFDHINSQIDQEIASIIKTTEEDGAFVSDYNLRLFHAMQALTLANRVSGLTEFQRTVEGARKGLSFLAASYDSSKLLKVVEALNDLAKATGSDTDAQTDSGEHSDEVPPTLQREEETYETHEV